MLAGFGAGEPECLGAAKSDLPRDVLAEIFRKPASEDLGRAAAAPAKPGKLPRDEKATMQDPTITQKIQAAQQNLNVLRDSLNELAAKPE